MKEEEVDLTDHLDFHDAYTRIGQFLDDLYTRKRILSSLDYLTPTEFGAQWHLQRAQPALLS